MSEAYQMVPELRLRSMERNEQIPDVDAVGDDKNVKKLKYSTV